MRVEGSFAVLGTEPIQNVYGVTAINEGLVPVALSSAGVEVEGASQFFAIVRFVMQSGGQLSLVLGPGESWQGMMDADEFAAGVSEIAGDRQPPYRVRVSVGGPGSTRYASDWFDYTP